MPEFDVITFGETMIRLSPPNCSRLESCDVLDLRIGGTESNTAVALARLGRRVAWCSKLVDNPLGRRIENEIRRWGVDTSQVIWDDSGRVGVYFIEYGAKPRPHHVYYDRADSAISKLDAEAVDWSHLGRARHLHLTGITSALSESCAAAVSRAVAEARARGLAVSFDVNYRRKLWPPDRARAEMSATINGIDLLFCPIADAADVFGFSGSPEAVAKEFREEFGIPTVVVTSGADGALAVTDDGIVQTQTTAAAEIDRIGTGDAFDAGVIDGFLDGDIERGMRFGVAMAALKHTIPGDQLISTRAEIEACSHGIAAGVIR